MNKPHYLIFAMVSITLVLVFSIPSFSYGQATLHQNEFPPVNGIFIFVQTSIYDKDGQLVSYFTTDQFRVFDYLALFIMVESEANENDPIITIDGKKFQVITRKLVDYQDEDSLISSDLLYHNTEFGTTTVLRFVHDGYPILEGEKAESIWTFVRPVN